MPIHVTLLITFMLSCLIYGILLGPEKTRNFLINRKPFLLLGCLVALGYITIIKNHIHGYSIGSREYLASILAVLLLGMMIVIVGIFIGSVITIVGRKLWTGLTWCDNALQEWRNSFKE